MIEQKTLWNKKKKLVFSKALYFKVIKSWDRVVKS